MFFSTPHVGPKQWLSPYFQVAGALALEAEVLMLVALKRMETFSEHRHKSRVSILVDNALLCKYFLSLVLKNV